MYGRQFFSDFYDDPFFSPHQHHLSRMDDMFRNPFGSAMMNDPFMALTDGRDTDRHGRSRNAEPRNSHRDMMLADPFMSNPFALMDQMMSSTRNMMANAHRQMEVMPNDPDAHFYSQSSVMSFSNTGDGRPKYYQATSATRQAPGGVRETKKAVRDSEAGVEKMSVGRHIYDRGHVITRQRDARTGQIEENQDMLNIDENEAPQFDAEWQRKAHSHGGHRRHGGHEIDGGRTRYDDDTRRGSAAGRGDRARVTSAITDGRGVDE